MKLIFVICLIWSSIISAKEIALSFDDAPMSSSKHFETNERTDELIRKLKVSNVPPVMIFANACKRENSAEVIAQLKKYKSAGHLIGNHSCSHPRLDDAGFAEYSKDVEKGDKLLAPLFSGQKFFRFPYLNESKDEKLRDQMREWLKANEYRNGMVSVDDDDYIFSFKINQARNQGKIVDYSKIEKLFLEHVVGAANFYDELAIKAIGRSPKHVILLHEMDATVMNIEALVKALRKDGWTIISVEEAYKDSIYLEQPKNTYSGNGIIAQLYLDKTGEKIGYNHFDTIKDQLDQILGIKNNEKN